MGLLVPLPQNPGPRVAAAFGSSLLRPLPGGIVAGRRSTLSLYEKRLATYDAGDAFAHAAAVGFIEIFGLPLRTEAARHGAIGDRYGAAWTWTDPLLADLPTTVVDQAPATA